MSLYRASLEEKRIFGRQILTSFLSAPAAKFWRRGIFILIMLGKIFLFDFLAFHEILKIGIFFQKFFCLIDLEGVA